MTKQDSNNSYIGQSIQWCQHPLEETILAQEWKTDVIISQNDTFMYTNRGKRFHKGSLIMAVTDHQAYLGTDKWEAWQKEYQLHHLKSASLNTLKELGIVCSGYTKDYGKDQCKVVVQMLKDQGYEFDYEEEVFGDELGDQ